MWALRYLFYRLYRWQVRCWKDEKVSINALVLVVVFLWMNLVTLVGLAESLCGTSVLLARYPQKLFHISTLVFMALIAVPLYFTLIYGKKYEDIVKEFEAESAHQRRTRGIGVLLYIVFSLVFLFAGAMLHGKMISH